MQVLGSGIDGAVVFPPIECDKLASIEPHDFVGKIHFKGKLLEEVKLRMDALPNEYDGVLYYKENYLCEIVVPEELKVKYSNKLSNFQLILKRVEGETLLKKLDNCVINNDGCKFFELLHSSINTYYIIKELAEKNVFHNDYKTDNVMVDGSGRFILVDLDAISYGTPQLVSTRFLGTTNLSGYHVEGSTAYRLWHDSYIRGIMIDLLSAMFRGENSEGEYMIDTFDEAIKLDFIKRKTEFERIINKPYKNLDYRDIDTIRDNLGAYQVICCEGARGTRKKVKKTKNKNKKNKKQNKLKRTIRK